MWHSSLAPQAATDNEIHCISEPGTRVLHQGIMWVVYMSALVKATSKPQERVQTGVTGWYTQSWTNTHLIDRNTLRIPANFYNLYFIFHSLYAPLTEVRRDCQTTLGGKREGSPGLTCTWPPKANHHLHSCMKCTCMFRPNVSGVQCVQSSSDWP